MYNNTNYTYNRNYLNSNTYGSTNQYNNYSSSSQRQKRDYDIINNKNYGMTGSNIQSSSRNQPSNDYNQNSKYGSSYKQSGHDLRIRDVNSQRSIYKDDLAKKSSSTYQYNAQNYLENQKKEEEYKQKMKLKKELEEKEKEELLYQSKTKSINNSYMKGPEPKARSDKGIVGLQNIGNTCFMNSALQCVFNVPCFNDFFLKGQYESELRSRNKGIAKQYANLLYKIRQKGNRGGESTYDLKRCIERVSSQFQGYSQQDAQELLRVVLDGLHEDLNRIQKQPKYRELEADPKKQSLQAISDDWFNYYKDRDDSIVYDYFCGQMMNKVICTRCDNESIAFDNFLDLSLSFTKGLQRLQEFSLERLLEHFLKEEPLDDEYHCSKCKKGRISNRKFEFYKMPNILVIHLKRFKFGRTSYGSQKLNQAVKFPITNLDLSNFVRQSKDKSCQDCVYDLTGIVNHSGSIYGGHYTADCMNPYDHRWYRFNDASVSEINIDSQGYDTRGGSSPYILFYAKRKLIQ